MRADDVLLSRLLLEPPRPLPLPPGVASMLSSFGPAVDGSNSHSSFQSKPDVVALLLPRVDAVAFLPLLLYEEALLPLLVVPTGERTRPLWPS